MPHALNELFDVLGTTWSYALATVLTTAVIYGILVYILNKLGQRLYATPSSIEVAVVAMLGAIVGRTTLGPYPTLAAGIIALLTLLGLELSVGAIRDSGLVKQKTQHRAIAVMVNGKIRRDVLYRFHLGEVDLWAALRAKGISDPSQVSLVILESSGKFSVFGKDAPIHSAALTGVRESGKIRAAIKEFREGKTKPKTKSVKEVKKVDSEE